MDLDPTTPGQQKTLTTANGTYTLQSGGNVNFIPASQCVSGSISTPYLVKDSLGRLSNPANIVVTVGGITGELFNFEDGTDTWAAASYSTGAGTTAQATIGATSCTHSLQINATGGGFFGPTYNMGPLPLATAGISQLLFDITDGLGRHIAVRCGAVRQRLSLLLHAFQLHQRR